MKPNSPVVDLQKCQVCLSGNLLLLILRWIWVLQRRTGKKDISAVLLARHQQRLDAQRLTPMCWKSHERMTLVACLGRTPRLFLVELSS